jgi:hypothetical protein
MNKNAPDADVEPRMVYDQERNNFQGSGQTPWNHHCRNPECESTALMCGQKIEKDLGDDETSQIYKTGHEVI